MVERRWTHYPSFFCYKSTGAFMYELYINAPDNKKAATKVTASKTNEKIIQQKYFLNLAIEFYIPKKVFQILSAFHQYHAVSG